MRLFQKIGNWIRNAFSDISEVIEDKAPEAVQLTQLIKQSIESHNGSIQWVLDRLKEKKLNSLYNFAKDRLPDLIHELAIIDGLAEKTTPKDQAWSAYSMYLQTKIKSARVKEWVAISANILSAIIGRKAPESLLIIATQWAYERLFGKK